MKRPVLALLACLLFASIGFARQSAADAPASKADIERYLDAMHTREMMKNVMGTVSKQALQMAHAQLEKQPTLPPDFEARMDKMMDDTFKDFPVDELLEAMIPVYQKHLTKGDVDGLVAFYTSPTGQKILRETPAMTAEAMQASSGIMQRMMAQTMQRVQDEIAQVQKSSAGSSGKQTQLPH